jgi:hypothetical protein
MDGRRGVDLVVGVEVARLPRPVGELSDAGLAERLRRVERELRRVEAEVAAVLAEAERRGVHQADGHRGAGSWAQATVRWSRVETQDRVRLARLGVREPSVAAGLREGWLGVAQARLLAKVAANPRCGDQVTGEVLDVLLDAARTLGFEDFAIVVRRWEQLADADGAHGDSERAHARRGLWCHTVGHTTFLKGRFGSAQAAQLREVLDAYTRAEFAADQTTASPRTHAQRCADALLAALGDAAGTPPDHTTARVPTVNIVVDEATFTDAVTRAATGRRRCETLTGEPVDPADALAAALVGHVRRVIMDATGTVIDLGRRRRLFTGASREAVWLQERHCLWPGCRSPHTQTDHMRDWSDQGATTPANAAPLCGHHNRWKTDHGYRTWRDPTGHWHLTRPNGTDITPI